MYAYMHALIMFMTHVFIFAGQVVSVWTCLLLWFKARDCISSEMARRGFS